MAKHDEALKAMCNERRGVPLSARRLTIGGSHISVKAVHDRFYTYMCGQSRFDIDSTPICDPISSPYRAILSSPLSCCLCGEGDRCHDGCCCAPSRAFLP